MFQIALFSLYCAQQRGGWCFFILIFDNINLLRLSFQITKEKYKFKIIAICILKNHIHALIKPENINQYPYIIKSIKTKFSKRFDINNIKNYNETESRKNKNEKSIWQRRYFEHTIKNEEELLRHIDYILFNPTKHYNIAPKIGNIQLFSNLLN